MSELVRQIGHSTDCHFVIAGLDPAIHAEKTPDQLADRHLGELPAWTTGSNPVVIR
jgi:hypothetical protein